MSCFFSRIEIRSGGGLWGTSTPPSGTGTRSTKKFYRKLTRYSAALALVADTAMLTLGGKLKQKERLSARLGDVLSQLYIGSAMLKRYEILEHNKAAGDAYTVAPRYLKWEPRLDFIYHKITLDGGRQFNTN